MLKRSCIAAMVAWFVAAVMTNGGVIFFEPFSYPDGILQNVSSNRWAGHSGTTNQVDVSNGSVQLTGAESQDVNALLIGQPYTAANFPALYCSFKLVAAALPSTTGSYFAHWKDAASAFRGRIWTLGGGANSNSFRLGITAASGSAPAAVHHFDLKTNITYLVVTRTFLSNAVTALWVDPAGETDPHVTSESAAPIAVAALALRQAGGIGTLRLDDILVGNEFRDVVPAVPAPAPSAPADAAPVIVIHPQSVTIESGRDALFSVEARGAALEYQWLFNGKEIPGATNRTVTVQAAGVEQQGMYRVRVSNALGAALSQPAELAIFRVAPPVIVVQPTNQVAMVGTSVSFSVLAEGDSPLRYQWQFNGTNLSGFTRETLTLTNATVAHAGVYRVVVSNSAGTATSEPAALAIVPPPPTVMAARASYLRTLVDFMNYLPNDSTTLFALEGIVTTHVNLAGADDALFHLQDASGAMAVTWKGGAKAIPSAGDRVRVTGTMTHASGLLLLEPRGSNDVRLLSTSNPLPSPVAFDFSWQTNVAAMELYEARSIVVSNVFLDVTPAAFRANENVTMTNEAGQTFVMRVHVNTDIPGQTKPAGPVTIFGVLSQSDGSNPRTSGYHFVPTRWADFVPAPPPPEIVFTNVLQNLVRPGDLATNTFTEQVLRPGEKLLAHFRAAAASGGEAGLVLETAGLPPEADWRSESLSSSNAVATLAFAAREEDAGSNYVVTVRATSAAGTSRIALSIYVPTAPESAIVLSEFLANPAITNSAPHFNPLGRGEPSPNPSAEDEFIELANAGAFAADLSEWTLSDAVQVRHRFPAGFLFRANSTFVVYGGPASGFLPKPGIAAMPASAGAAGLGLNNAGDTILLRNAAGRLISRVVYSNPPPTSSLARWPDLSSPFVPHAATGRATSPGVLESKPPAEPTKPAPASPALFHVTLEISGVVILRWNAEAGRRYSVFRSPDILGPYTALADNLTFTDDRGSYVDENMGNSAAHFYRVSSP